LTRENFFDGKLSEIVDRFADFKFVTIQCDKANEYPRKTGALRRVVEKTPSAITSRLNATASSHVQGIAGRTAVSDIDIQEVR